MLKKFFIRDRMIMTGLILLGLMFTISRSSISSPAR